MVDIDKRLEYTNKYDIQLITDSYKYTLEKRL